jgi:hypothetical protein
LLSNSPVTECVLRVNAGETRFDPEYRGSLADAVGGRSVVAVGRSGSSIVAAVLDETAPTFVPFEPGAGYAEFVANVGGSEYALISPALLRVK